MDQNLINKIINRNAAAFDRTFMRRNRDGDDWWSDSKLNISSLIKEFEANGADIHAVNQFRKLAKHINSIRGILNRSQYWPTSVMRARSIVSESFKMFSPHTSFVGSNYLDIGCGNSQPLGTSSVFYLNGAATLTALDIDDMAHSRAAVSLYDILAECALFPDDWHYSDISREEFLERIHHFDLRALNQGRLKDGLRNLPIEHVVGDVALCEGMDSRFDVASSRVVLEHFMEFDKDNTKIFEMLKPGGIVAHKIDLSDHRKKQGLHAFSFLAEENWTGHTNRLRSSEIKATFENIGYELLVYETRSQSMPTGFENQLLKKYREMDRNDLEITEIDCVLRRPL